MSQKKIRTRKVPRTTKLYGNVWVCQEPTCSIFYREVDLDTFFQLVEEHIVTVHPQLLRDGMVTGKTFADEVTCGGACPWHE